jgi:hypothetical protein
LRGDHLGKGRRLGQRFASDYIEVRYEELVLHPEKTLTRLGEFLDHDLEYGRIQKNAIGRLLSPNTVWKEETGASFNPINRWKTKLFQREISALEALIGNSLDEFAYPLTTGRASSAPMDLTLRLMDIFYPRLFETKLFLQSKTILGRLANGARLELDPV